ncbi:hypothetical protein [Streptomyces sp. WMMB303]|uniref:hypothetical protein n=1 Tax=unclassified Streptomyces TaxID=2593676 RepID=UPI0023EA7DBC|nr:hypothetical protein [Streptomyces sp. WMMB303]MDF4254691.1 hypothetical protein [Streptomyces sp. WMMB303]
MKTTLRTRVYEQVTTVLAAVVGPLPYLVCDCRRCGQVAQANPPAWKPPCRCARPRPRWLPRRARHEDLLHYPLYLAAHCAPSTDTGGEQ